MVAPSTATRNTVTRLDIPTGRAFDEFIAAFETAVPPFDLRRGGQVAEEGGTRGPVQRVVTENAPNALVVFSVIDGYPLMALAGHTRKALQYLVGNHLVAERMY